MNTKPDTDQLRAFLNHAAHYGSPTQQRRNHFLSGKTYKTAAVLLAVVLKEAQWHILLIRRSDRLRQHTGQIALAGGRRDPQDLSLTHTALRETEEEIGVAAAHWQTFPALAPHYSPSGYEVHPVPALCTDLPPLELNSDEVAEAFYLPLALALNPASYGSRRLSYQGQSLDTPALPYLHYDIWGLTAVILYSLAERYALYRQTLGRQ